MNKEDGKMMIYCILGLILAYMIYSGVKEEAKRDKLCYEKGGYIYHTSEPYRHYICAKPDDIKRISLD